MKYKFKEWSDLTIQDCIDIVDIDMPESLKDLYSSKDNDQYSDKYDKISDKIRIKNTEYYGKVMKIMTNIPSDIIDTLQWWERIDIYETHLQQFVIDLYSQVPNYISEEIKTFEFEGDTFFIPESLKVLDRLIPMPKETALTYTEGAEFFKQIIEMQEKGIEKFPMLIAILCRRKDEQYDETLTLARAERFKQLPMSIAWEVFFYIYKQLSISIERMQTYTETISTQIQSMKTLTEIAD